MDAVGWVLLGMLLGGGLVAVVFWMKDAGEASAFGQELEAMRRAVGPEDHGPYDWESERVRVRRK